jgi:tRNA modification GTPase
LYAQCVCGELAFGDRWRVSLKELRDAKGVVLDQGIVVSYPAPRSFTGEDMLEVTIHGSPYLVDALMDSFMAAGARPAEPGEFTRRAVANGKLDLVQAEAVRDLVDADTAWQHRNAREQLSGALSKRFSALRLSLVKALGAAEAALDYEAQGVEVARSEQSALLEESLQQIHSLLATADAGARIRDGLRVVILGPPNSGKSTLFNYLCGSERAIVSPRPGTTRDLLEAELDISGIRIVVQDTAGLRAAGDEVELEGQRRAQAAAASADLAVLLWALDGSPEPPVAPPMGDTPVIRLRSKSDLSPRADGPEGWFRLSCRSGEGLDALHQEVSRRARGGIADLGGAVAIAARHRHALEDAVKELEGCNSQFPETVAESLRWALRSIDQLIGEVVTDDVLDEVFSAFCIGK